MSIGTIPERVYGLDRIGLTDIAAAHWNLTTAALTEQAVRNREGLLAHLGPLVARTGSHTGRSPSDKYIVDEPGSRDQIWWGAVNHPFPSDAVPKLHERQLAYLRDKELYVQDCYVGADPGYRIRLRVITELAWHSQFARNMFLRETDPEVLRSFEPDFTILDTPSFHANPETDGTRSGTFIMLDLARRLVLIGGTAYAGEIKKSAFTLMNYLLPQQGVLPMHCSANYGVDTDDVALFFGLSGTGKTTLSTSEDRMLIGDDEHGWSDQGVFNFEGGCYAKVIGIRAESEPEIYDTTRRFGTILENVTIDPLTRRLDLDDASLTENTRAAYPITHIPRADEGGMAGHPRNVIFLTYDAFGVLPPVSRLTEDQAQFHFLLGYTSKVAGTESGVKEPTAAFSTCFGAPFLPLRPQVYARLLRDRIRDHGSDCWLINTGLTGGPYGVGRRMPIALTRSIVAAVLRGDLKQVPTREVPAFHLSVPRSCPGVPVELLDPRGTWADPDAYDLKAAELASLFEKNAKPDGNS
jgi:phosphoenolpyruvate carboxykinase (ATP)